MQKKHYSIWITLAVILLTGHTLQGQVAIGDGELPRKGAILDLKKSSGSSYIGGLVLPNVNITDLGKIPADFTDTDVKAQETNMELAGTVVYNTNATTGQGVYYWDGNDWQKVNSEFNKISLNPYNPSSPPEAPAEGTGQTPMGPYTPKDEPACNNGYDVVVVTGMEYASVEVDAGTGKFSMAFQPNNTAFSRNAIVRVMNNCTGEYKDFIFKQAGATCPNPANDNPVLNASAGTICSGGRFYMYVTNIDADATYIWTLNNKQVGMGTSFETDQAGTYRVYSDVVGCGTPGEITLASDKNTTSPASIGTIMATNGGIICSGGEVILTALNTQLEPGQTITWYKNGVLQTGTAREGESIVLDSPSDIGNWFAVVKEDDCFSQASNSVSVNTSSTVQLTAPTFTINGEVDPDDVIFCKGGLLELKVTNNYSPVNVSYQWFADGNPLTTDANPNNGTFYTILPDANSVAISVTVSSTGYCSSSSTSGNKSVTIKATNATSINTGSSSAFICGNNPASLQAGGNGIEYYWYKDDGNGSFNREATTSVNQFNATLDGKYKVSYKDNNGCLSNLSPEIKVVRTNAVNLTWNLFPDEPHPGDVLTYSVKASPQPEQISWETSLVSGSGAAVVTPLSDPTEANIDFSGITGAAKVNIKVNARNGCGPVSINKEVDVVPACTPLTSAQISPYEDFNLKEGNKYTFTATAGNGTAPFTYTWYVDGIQQQSGSNNKFEYTAPAYSSVPSNNIHKVKVSISNCMSVGNATSTEVTVNTTPNEVNYTNYQGTASITGKYCFDVKMTDTGAACGTLNSRTNDFTDGSGNPKYDFDYTFNISGATATDLVFTIEDAGSITQNITTAGNIGTLQFKPDIAPSYTSGGVRSMTSGNAMGNTVMLYALFKVSGVPYKISFTINIKDCTCCGTGGVPGIIASSVTGFTYKTHMYGNDCWMVSNSKEGIPSSTKHGTTQTTSNPSANGYYYSNTNRTTACPEGWHLPVATEWTTLMQKVNADKTNTGKWWTMAAHDALAGYGTPWFLNEGDWWSAVSGYRYLGVSSGMSGPGYYPALLFSVRCVQNK